MHVADVRAERDLEPTADGRAVVLHELRDNAEPYAWLDGLDAPEQPDFVVMPDTLARIRERVEELNAG